MNRLQSLPAIILDHIMLQLDVQANEDLAAAPNRRRRMDTLLALALTSKQLRTATEPVLYRSFSSCRRPGKLRPFLRMLCQRPELASHVQILVIFSSDMPDFIPKHEERRLFREALSTFNVWPLHDVLLNALLSGCATAEVVLLLLLCPNLQNLRLHLWNCSVPIRFRDCPPMVECLTSFFVWSKTTNHKIFAHLENLTLGPSSAATKHTGITVPYDLVCHFLQLPLIRQLKIDKLVSTQETLPAWVQHSNVSQLYLQEYTGDTQSLLDLLRHCKPLQNFNITRSKTVHRNAEVLVDGLLQHHRDTLTELRLHRGNDSRHAISNLHEFKQLRDLEINANLLGIAKRGTSSTATMPPLPSSLKHLCIFSSGRVGLDHLAAMLARSLPQLRPELEHFAVVFGVRAGDSGKYIHLIPEMHRGSPGTVVVSNIAMKDQTDWIITLGYTFPGIRLLCRKGERNVSATVAALIRRIEEKGVDGVLRKYYRECPTPSADELLKLVSIRRRGCRLR